MKDQQHSIRKQNLRVNAVTGDGFALKRRVETLMDEIPVKLNALFNELVDEQEWLQLDQLNISIEGINEQHLEKQLTQRIVQEVKEKIIQQKQEALTGSFRSDTQLKISASFQKNINAFYYFLENGMLPWWFEFKPHTEWEKEIRMAFEKQEQVTIKGNESASYSPTRLIMLLQQSAARHRLLEQFSADVFAEVLKQIFNGTSSVFYNSLIATLQTLNKLKETASPEISLNKTQLKKIKTIVLEQCISSQFSESAATALALMILNEIEKTEKIQLKAELMKTELFVQYYKPDLTSDLSALTKKQKALEDEQTETMEKREGKDVAAIQKKTLAQQLTISEGALVTNAGVVLLWPFLPELFKRCGLLEDKVLINPAKAIAMIHFLAHGNCDYKEYDVLLNKVLCNWDENKDIELVDSFSEAEITEMEGLLDAAISHWTALKGTTAAGLREGFLCRQGKLMLKQDDWFLQVEKQTHDILLQQLPWSIGMVKLAWMEKMLRTEWV